MKDIYIDSSNRHHVHQSLLWDCCVAATAEPKALASRYISLSMQYQKFVVSPPKSFYKALFLETKLGQALQKMSANKAVPVCLKNQECKKGNCKQWPPIPYVPVVDEVQEVVSKGTRGRSIPTRSNSPIRQSLVYPSGTLGPRRPFSFMCNRQKACARGRGWSKTTKML